MDGFEFLGRGQRLGVPMPVVVFAMACGVVSSCMRGPGSGLYIYAIGDNPLGARVTGVPTRRSLSCHIVLAALIGCFAGLVLVSSSTATHADFQFDADHDVIWLVVLGHRSLRGPRRCSMSLIWHAPDRHMLTA